MGTRCRISLCFFLCFLIIILSSAVAVDRTQTEVDINAAPSKTPEETERQRQQPTTEPAYMNIYTRDGDEWRHTHGTFDSVVDVFNTLGWTVRYNEARRTIMVITENIIVFLPTGFNRFLIRETGVEDKLSDIVSIPAHIQNGKLILPISEIASALGWSVIYDETSKTFTVGS